MYKKLRTVETKWPSHQIYTRKCTFKTMDSQSTRIAFQLYINVHVLDIFIFLLHHIHCNFFFCLIYEEEQKKSVLRCCIDFSAKQNNKGKKNVISDCQLK